MPADREVRRDQLATRDRDASAQGVREKQPQGGGGPSASPAANVGASRTRPTVSPWPPPLRQRPALPRPSPRAPRGRTARRAPAQGGPLPRELAIGIVGPAGELDRIDAFRLRPRLQHRALRPIADDTHRPAVLPQPRGLPGPKGCQRVLLRLEPLQDEDDAARLPPEARRGRDTVQENSVRAALHVARDELAHGDLPRQLRRDQRREGTHDWARASSCREVARADDRRAMQRACRDSDRLGDRHVDMADVLPADPRQRAKALDRCRSRQPSHVRRQSLRHAPRVAADDRDLPVPAGELGRRVRHVALDTGELARDDDVDDARHRLRAAQQRGAAARAPRVETRATGRCRTPVAREDDRSGRRPCKAALR